MLKHTLILVFLAAFGASSAVAQEVMTLEKALEVAFEHSPSLIQSKLSLEQQQLNLKAQNASLKSQFSLDVNPFNYTRNNQYDSYNAKWYSSENMSSSASLGITQPIKWTDGTVSLYNDFSWQDASNQTSNQKSTSFNHNLSLRIEQPIFTYNRTKMELKELEYALENSKLSYAMQELSIERQVTQQFYSVYQQQKNLSTARDEYNNQKQNYDIIKNKVDAGLVAREELFQAEVNLATSESAVYTAEINYENAKDNFKILLGIDLNEDVEDDETQTPTPETRQYIESAVFIAIQEGVSNTFKMDVSLHNLDSIYAHMLDSVGISAKVSTCMMDSLGNVLRASSPQAKLEGQKYLRTRLVPINKAYTRYLQGVILNPYWVIFQRMTLLLIATVLIMVLVIICIVYQIRVIIRQDKIAKMREDFSYAMIHDMKTPLSSILMGTEILESGRLDGQPEKKERYFRIVKEEGEHLLALTNKVLTLSKLENHALKLQQADCLLRPILEDLAEKYKAKTTKQVAFVWDLQEDVVWADEEFLKEALSNLIDNALKYSGEAVEITFLSERKADGTVCVTVADNGFGIPLKDQRKIFEKYERAAASERSRSGGASGFGLGLNYVLRIMEAHGGRVTLESMEGEYSRFTLAFPPESVLENKKEER